MQLFRKDLEPRCAYCALGSQINEREVTCTKQGIMPMEGHCRRFKYDPLRREPPRPAALDTSRLRAEDFSL